MRSANAEDHATIGRLAEAIQEASGEVITVAFVDQGDTSERPAAVPRAHGIGLHVVRRPEATLDFELLPYRWDVKRFFAQATRLRRMVKD